MKKALGIILVLALLGTATWLGWRLWQVRPAATDNSADLGWRIILDERYDGTLEAYRQRWDNLAQPHEAGSFALRAWPHISLQRQPRASMRLTAWPTLGPSSGERWQQLLLASAVEYFDHVSSGGHKLPRSKVAAAFGRLDLKKGRLTLSVGQLGLNGSQHRVVSAGFSWSPQDATLPLRLELDGDRLTLSLGARQVSTLADQVLPGADEALRAGINGERSQISRLLWESVRPAPEESVLAQADKYLAFGRPEQSLPLLDELLAASPTARVQMRKASLLGLLGQDDAALAIYRQLMAPGQDGFYAAYAAVARAALERKSGRPSLQLERDLRAWTSPHRGHPALGQAALLRARLIGEALGTGTAFQQLCRQVLAGNDPAAAQEVLTMLTTGPLALSETERMLLLEEVLGEGAALSQSVFEAISAEQALLQARNGQLEDLVQSALAARSMSYNVRNGIYRELSNALDKAGPSRVRALLAGAANDGAFLRDFLHNNGYPLTRHPSARAQRSIAEEEALTLLQARVVLGGGPEKKGSTHPFFEPSSASAKSYGHQPQAPAELRGDALCLDFKSGDYWGCGVALHPNLGKLSPGGASDLSGARRLRCRVRAPEGAEYFFMLSESGIGPVSAVSHQGEAGADGEQYLLPVQIGTGTWQDLDLALDQATPVLAWGNLEGNFTLDLQAIQKLDLAIPGQQGSGEICIKDLRFSGR